MLTYRLTAISKGIIRHKKKTFIVIASLEMFVCGCTTSITTPKTTDIPMSAIPTLTDTPMSTTLTPTDASVTATPTSTESPISATSTSVKVANLDYCQLTDLEICIDSISQTAKNEFQIVLIVNKNNNDTSGYHILLNEESYDCVQIAGLTDEYFCQNLSLRLDEYTHIQVYSTGSIVPLAEGNIYIDKAQFLEPTPKPTTCGPPSGWVIYIVRRGDNLFRLARRTKTTVPKLKKANCLVSDTIYAGQELYLPFIPPPRPPDPYTP
jgi:hypothetical protein